MISSARAVWERGFNHGTVELRLAAVLAADVAGYPRWMGADKEGTLARLKAHRRELVDPKIAEHRGRIVKTTGDGLLVPASSQLYDTEYLFGDSSRLCRLFSP